MSDSTKEKILLEATKLFAAKSFNSVSVREIAKSCNVNVAAINYHFQSKEALYIQILSESILKMEKDMKEIYDSLDQKEPLSFMEKAFDHFLQNSDELKSSFKIVLATSELDQKISEDYPRFSGPPGGEYLKKCIQNLINKENEDIEWAVRILFSQIIHTTLVLSNLNIKSSLKESGITIDKLKKDFKRLTRIIIADLKNTP